MRTPRLLAVLVLAGCARQPGDLNADGLIDCRDLDGTFEADALRFDALDDPDLVEDFDGLPDVTTDLSFADRTFTTTLRLEGETLTSTGEWFADDDGTLVVTNPLVPGMAARVTRFDCAFDFDARELRIVGATGFDFAGDDAELVDADFEGTFVPL